MAMKEKSKKSVALNAYGKKLAVKVPYDFKWSEYEGIDDVKLANDMLNDEEIVKTRNKERKSAARQKALTNALTAAGINKPDLENDPQYRLREMVKVIMSGGKHTEESARDLASATLGIEWEDEDED